MALFINQLHSKDINQLKTLLREYQAELYLLKFKASTGQLDTTHKIREFKKDIARILTIINQKKQNKVLKAKKSFKEEKSEPKEVVAKQEVKKEKQTKETTKKVEIKKQEKATLEVES